MPFDKFFNVKLPKTTFEICASAWISEGEIILVTIKSELIVFPFAFKYVEADPILSPTDREVKSNDPPEVVIVA